MSIVEFLEARIAEDEAGATLADSVTDKVEDDWQDVTQPITHAVTQGRPQEPWAERYGYAYEHIARHDPARVLAECAAKRAMIRYAAMLDEQGEQSEVFGYHATGLRVGIKFLAAVYSDHPDYNPDWRP